MDIRANLLNGISAYLKETGLSEAKFGKAAVGDAKLVWRLRTGKGFTSRTYDNVIAFIRDNPPASGNGAA